MENRKMFEITVFAPIYGEYQFGDFPSMILKAGESSTFEVFERETAGREIQALLNITPLGIGEPKTVVGTDAIAMATDTFVFKDGVEAAMMFGGSALKTILCMIFGWSKLFRKVYGGHWIRATKVNENKKGVWVPYVPTKNSSFMQLVASGDFEYEDYKKREMHH